MSGLCLVMVNIFIVSVFVDLVYAQSSVSECVYKNQNSEQVIKKSDFIGDVNGDGNINSIDFALMRRYLLDSKEIFPISNGTWAADTDGNGIFNSIDFAYMRQFLLGIINAFPIEDYVPKNCFDYALFSGDTENDLRLFGNTIKIYGEVRSNSNIVIGDFSDIYIEDSLNAVGNIINYNSNIGLKKENVNEYLEFPDLKKYYYERRAFFSTQYSPETGKMYVDEFVDSKGRVIDKRFDTTGDLGCVYKSNGVNQEWNIFGTNLTLDYDTPMFFDGNVKMSVEKISGEGIIIATGDIRITSNIGYKNNVAIYSMDGDINCYMFCDEFNGLLYAPNGRVSIDYGVFRLYGSIVGKRIDLFGDNEIVYCRTRLSDYFVD